jgi:ABC-2 type transport system permease protein
VALPLLTLFALGTILVGERLYRRSLLQNQGRVSLRQAWTAAE